MSEILVMATAWIGNYETWRHMKPYGVGPKDSALQIIKKIWFILGILNGPDLLQYTKYLFQFLISKLRIKNYYFINNSLIFVVICLNWKLCCYKERKK
jgi:hypothetical protein